MMFRITLSFLGLLCLLSLSAQERIQPGKMYKGGDYLYAPLTGTSLKIPAHWRGYGTQETEMLTLSSDTSNATMRIFSVQDNLVSIRSRISSGFEISPGVVIMPVGEPNFSDNILSTELVMSNDKNISGYYFVKCGEYGNCLGFLFGTQTKTHTLYFDGLNEMLHDVTLEEPKIVEAGGDFNWANELGGKHLFHYESNRSGTLGNQIWLCSDGTFTAKIKRKGMFNQGNQKKIKGNHNGTYRFDGVGTQGKLILVFESMDSVSMELAGAWKDGDIYFNGIKYYKAVHQKCK